MLKEAKKVPAIRFRGFTDDWEQHKLGDVCQITMGQSPDGATYSEEPSDYILIQGNADLQNGWVTPRVWTTQKTKMADAGDLIMSVRAPAGAMGKTAYKAVIGRGVAAIKGNEFIYQTLIKMDSNSYWKRLAAGSTFESINSDTIFNAEIMLPSELEQTKIGKIFDSIDNLITLHQRKLDQQKKLKKYFLQNMFPGKGEKVPRIRFKGFTGDWEERKLNTIADVRDGTHDSPQYRTGGHPFITSKNIKDGFINYADVQYISSEDFNAINKRSKVEVNDILMGMIGTIGNMALVREKPDYAIKNVALIKDTKKVHYLYLYHFLHSNNVEMQLFSGIDGGTQKFISLNNIRKLNILLPNLEEQVILGSFFENIDYDIILRQRKLDHLQIMKKFMLQNMFI